LRWGFGGVFAGHEFDLGAEFLLYELVLVFFHFVDFRVVVASSFEAIVEHSSDHSCFKFFMVHDDSLEKWGLWVGKELF
jgi:hypothetical protein